MFDKSFFGKSFTEKIREFSRDNGDNDVRLEIVTKADQRLDVLRMTAADEGMRLYTRNEQMVFLPYEYVAYVDVSVLKDHRIVGFQLSGRSD